MPRWDHPRVCGEHARVPTGFETRTGSSPRVRGTLLGGDGLGLARGIIPACAGNTRRGRCSRWRAWDHPHVCGEHRFSRRSNVSHMGSSPRVRGTLLMDAESADAPGIIPACAGNTTSRTRPAERAKDHPRVCGEHLRLPPMLAKIWGSSPRVRGTPVKWVNEFVERGIIPACAGNTFQSRARRSCLRDHPRVCGEHFAMYQLGGWLSGSSPRVRGTLLADGERIGVHGIIPACAGNTQDQLGQRWRNEDHPRVCGEHS